MATPPLPTNTHPALATPAIHPSWNCWLSFIRHKDAGCFQPHREIPKCHFFEVLISATCMETLLRFIHDIPSYNKNMFSTEYLDTRFAPTHHAVRDASVENKDKFKMRSVYMF